ncbi:hypothetical protein KJA17_01280 [Patescibacteria group bacterium]|nr:hypothetical protein [Patescibacteria group bacterium]
MRKLVLLFLIVFLGGLFFPLVSSAGFYQADSEGACYNGLVPCGKEVCVGAFDKDSCRDLLKEAQKKVEEEDISSNKAFKEICGTTRLKEIRCQFCHFFVMLDGIIDFTVKYIVIPIAVLMIVVGGIMFMFSQFGGAELLPGGIKGGPKMLSQAKSLITSVVIGLIIIFAAYLIIGVVLAMIGLANTNPLKDWFTGNSFTINCPIELPPPSP